MKNKEIISCPNFTININQKTVVKNNGICEILVKNKSEINAYIKKRFDLYSVDFFEVDAVLKKLSKSEIISNKGLCKYENKIKNAYEFYGVIKFSFQQFCAQKICTDKINKRDEIDVKCEKINANIDIKNDKKNEKIALDIYEAKGVNEAKSVNEENFNIFVMDSDLQDADLDLYDEIELCSGEFICVGEIVMQIFSDYIEIL